MATTTNYSWTTPDNTAYVKDGASAIRSLGSSVDSTLFTALGGAYPGLRLVKKQTVGTGVSSVTVTSAFSATYDAYRIIYTNGVASTNNEVTLSLGGSTTGYYSTVIFAAYSGGGVSSSGANNTSSFIGVGYGSTNTFSCAFELYDPFNAKGTTYRQLSSVANTAGSGVAASGFLNNTNSHTAFTLTTTGGTLTGGTIYVYGYGIS